MPKVYAAIDGIWTTYPDRESVPSRGIVICDVNDPEYMTKVNELMFLKPFSDAKIAEYRKKIAAEKSIEGIDRRL